MNKKLLTNEAKSTLNKAKKQKKKEKAPKIEPLVSFAGSDSLVEMVYVRMSSKGLKQSLNMVDLF